jgi:hypothetical protein
MKYRPPPTTSATLTLIRAIIPPDIGSLAGVLAPAVNAGFVSPSLPLPVSDLFCAPSFGSCESTLDFFRSASALHAAKCSVVLASALEYLTLLLVSLFHS